MIADNSFQSNVAYNIRFAGQVFDWEAGLHQNGLTDCDLGTGRYVESDPFGLDGGTNTYAYAAGNPMLNIDPLGLDVTMGYFPGGPTNVSRSCRTRFWNQCASFVRNALEAGGVLLPPGATFGIFPETFFNALRWSYRSWTVPGNQ